MWGRALGTLALLANISSADEISGQWKLSYTMPDGTRHESTLDVEASGQNVTGKISSRRGTVEVTSGKLDGNSIEFMVVRRGNGDELHVLFKGVVEKSTMRLTMQYRDHDPVQIRAMRQASK